MTSHSPGTPEALRVAVLAPISWRVTGDEDWTHEIWRAFSWFLGENQLHASLYDPTTGGCRDGLHPDRPNENQGAESTLSFLLALTEMGALDSETRLRDDSAPALPASERAEGSA